jgi:hypothetical protein
MTAVNTYSGTNLTNSKTIIIDTTAPIATLSSDIAPTADLTMTFLEGVTKGAGNITIYDTTDTAINPVVIDVTTDQVSIDNTSKIITINPARNLIAGHNYYAQVDANTFKDTTGNDYAGINDKNTWGFTVAKLGTTAIWSNDSTDVADNGINASELSSLSITGTLSNLSNIASDVKITSIVFKAASGSAGDVAYSGTTSGAMPTLSSDSNGATWTLANAEMPTLVSGESYSIEVGLSAAGGITGAGGNDAAILVDTIAPTIAIFIIFL